MRKEGAIGTSRLPAHASTGSRYKSLENYVVPSTKIHQRSNAGHVVFPAGGHACHHPLEGLSRQVSPDGVRVEVMGVVFD
jgi:hypothetical protein